MGGVDLKDSPASEISERAREDRERLDLIAQQQAAGAARLQAALSLAGLVGLFFTVLYAKRAWKESKRGADAALAAVAQADRSANAAENAVAAAQDVAQRQLRAYVFSEEPQLVRLNGEVWRLTLQIKNSGQTPAYNGRVLLGCAVKPWPHDRLNFAPPSEDSDWQILGSLPPGGKSVIEDNISITMHTETLLALHQQVFYAFGEIQYEDAFKIMHWTRFRYFVGGDNDIIIIPGQMGLSREGNEADQND